MRRASIWFPALWPWTTILLCTIRSYIWHSISTKDYLWGFYGRDVESLVVLVSFCPRKIPLPEHNLTSKICLSLIWWRHNMIWGRQIPKQPRWRCSAHLCILFHYRHGQLAHCHLPDCHKKAAIDNYHDGRRTGDYACLGSTYLIKWPG